MPNQGEIIERFERLRAAYRRLEEKRAIFHKQVEEQGTFSPFALDAGPHVVEHLFVIANRMREVIDEIPADIDTLLARSENGSNGMGMDEDS